MTSHEDKFLGTVLVTGGAGIVGSHVIEELVKNPRCSKIVATYHSAKRHQHSCDNVDYHVCDIMNAVELENLLEKTQPTIIIHTVSPGPYASPDVQHQVNYLATKEIARQAKAHPTIQALIYTSSYQAVHINSCDATKPQTEEESKVNSLDSTTAISAYGRTKGAADALVLAANTGRKSGENVGDFRGQLLTTTLRVAGLYGERDLKTIWKMLKVVNTSATRFQIGPDTVMHEWVYTANVAQMHILAAEALLDGLHTDAVNKVDGEAFFVTDDSPLRFWEFSRQVWKAAGDRHITSSKNPKIIQIPFWLVSPAISTGDSLRKIFSVGSQEATFGKDHLEVIRRGSRLSVEKAKTRLGYRPVCNTAEGVKRSVDWFMKKENEVWFKT